VVAKSDWVLLAYRVPREPSAPRIAIWRRLKRLGVSQLLDGLVALPADAQTREQLDWVADEVISAGGTATVWVGRPVGSKNEREIVAAMKEAITTEYRKILDDVEAARMAPEIERRRIVARLRREVQLVAGRDYFPPSERERARRAVHELARLVAVSS
jgi:hypothetical protein